MQTEPRNFLDRARSVAGLMLLVGAALVIWGSLSDWVAIEPPPIVPPGEMANTRPFSGLAAGSGWITLVAGVAAALNAVLLLRLARSGFAWLAVLAAIIAGGVTMADYRATGDITSALSERMEIVGQSTPGMGMILCAIGVVLLLIGGAAGIAASPRVNR